MAFQIRISALSETLLAFGVHRSRILSRIEIHVLLGEIRGVNIIVRAAEIEINGNRKLGLLHDVLIQGLGTVNEEMLS
jgi:hypothetical protein